jgi:hypothetical protein
VRSAGYGSITVALDDTDEAEAPARMTMPEVAELVMTAVKPSMPESNPAPTRAKPIRLRMTFMLQPFRHLPACEQTLTLLQVRPIMRS